MSGPGAGSARPSRRCEDPGIDLERLTIGELLALSRRSLQELKRRSVVWTGNAPIGDHAELLVERATGVKLEEPSNASWDVLTPEGEKLQVKARIVSDERRSGCAPSRGSLRRMQRPFAQVDVFTTEPYRGNPVAVVLDASGLSDADMQQIAHWTNLSETTFVLVPSAAEADYLVRIFTPTTELPFAGHPTLGTCHAWLEMGGSPRDEAAVVQECAAGLVRIRRDDGRLAFAAPPLIRSGPVDEVDVARVARLLGIAREDIVHAQWADNGPGWVAVMLRDAEAVLALKPSGVEDMEIGVVGRHPEGGEAAWELRAFMNLNGAVVEDPVTGSLNASVAQWLLSAGHATAPYVAAQGTVLGRRGRAHISQDPDGTIWVGGGTVTCVSGQVELPV